MVNNNGICFIVNVLCQYQQIFTNNKKASTFVMFSKNKNLKLKKKKNSKHVSIFFY